MIIGLRRGAVNTGKWEDDYGTKLFLTLERNGNALGFASSEREKFIEKNELPIFDGTQEYCLWLGCMGAYDPQGREIVLSLAQVLRHLGVTFGVLRKEKCTGDPARRLGNDLLFQQLAEGNLETLRTSAKVTKMVSICPHCVRTIGDGLEGVRRGAPDRASQRISGAHAGSAAAADGAARDAWSFTIRATWAAIAAFTMQPREVIGALGRSGRSAARARAVVLLRRGRRADVPGRREGQARQRGARRRNWRRPARRWSARPARSARPCFAMRCGTVQPDAAEAAGYRADCGGLDRIRGRGAEWYNPELARRAGSVRADAAKPPEHLKRARSSIGRASDS